jgi:hypothetical protein
MLVSAHASTVYAVWRLKWKTKQILPAVLPSSHSHTEFKFNFTIIYHICLCLTRNLHPSVFSTKVLFLLVIHPTRAKCVAHLMLPYLAILNTSCVVSENPRAPLQWGVVSPLHHRKDRGPHLVGYPHLLTQYIRGYYAYLEAVSSAVLWRQYGPFTNYEIWKWWIIKIQTATSNFALGCGRTDGWAHEYG